MEPTSTPFSAPPRIESSQLLRRIAVPFFIFSAVLLSLLLLSWFLLLPRFTHVELQGALYSEDGLQEHGEDLSEKINALIRKRDDLVIPIASPTYNALKDRKHDFAAFALFRDAIEKLVKDISPQNDAIHLSEVTYDTAENHITIQGDVRFVGTHSMTLLASLTEHLSHLPFVASVTPPEFTRENDPHIGFHSPFTLTFTLQ